MPTTPILRLLEGLPRIAFSVDNAAESFFLLDFLAQMTAEVDIERVLHNRNMADPLHRWLNSNVVMSKNKILDKQGKKEIWVELFQSSLFRFPAKPKLAAFYYL